MSSRSDKTSMSGMFESGLEIFSAFSALRAAKLPSSVGMLVYMLVTSIVQRRVSFSNTLSSMVCIRCVVSLMYDGRRTTACFSQ